MRILFGYQNTKTNNEDFAITPYLFGYAKNGRTLSFYGIGICWGHAAFAVTLGFGVPKDYPTFKNYAKRKP